MIKINRADCPPILENANDEDDLYTREEVKDALYEMQYGKCCYCEKKIDKKGHGQAIEHFKPKKGKGFDHLKNEWSNLLHVCCDCNGQKGNRFPVDENGEPMIINPSDNNIDPEHHLKFNIDDENKLFTCRVSSRENSSKGKETIEHLGLDKPFRRRQRIEKWQVLFTALGEIIKAQLTDDVVTMQQNIHQFENLLYANSEYAALGREFAREKNLDNEYDMVIPTGADINH